MFKLNRRRGRAAEQRGRRAATGEDTRTRMHTREGHRGAAEGPDRSGADTGRTGTGVPERGGGRAAAERPAQTAAAAGGVGTGVPERGGGPAAAPRSRLGALMLNCGMPVVAAVFYGGYGAHLYRITGHTLGSTILMGAVMTVASALLMVAVMLVRRRLIPETRAAAFGAVFGAMFGWIYEVGGTASALRATLTGALLGAAMFIVMLYVFYNFGDRGRTATAAQALARHGGHRRLRHPVARPTGR
ncbi:hypothetical protein ACFV3R_16055 [Streptomyces sp. NPDC059740]|uniref:hypothetical protein n=1 Tax=Streptomyces sp. NPDC059740 TaxID=3346926 RepID=UPI00366559A1